MRSNDIPKGQYVRRHAYGKPWGATESCGVKIVLYTLGRYKVRGVCGQDADAEIHHKGG